MSSLVPAIEARRARRAVDSRPIPEDVLERVLHAATMAPSCSNNQPWRFVVLTESGPLSAVKDHLSSGNYWGKKSPCIVAAAARTADDCSLDDGREYALFDLGLATGNLILQAVEEGLIAHPIAGFFPVEVKRVLGIPAEYTLITLVLLGYPGSPESLSEKHRALEGAERIRRPSEEVVFRNRWRDEQ